MPDIHSTRLIPILSKTFDSCLKNAPELPYNWNLKLRHLVITIALRQSLVLQDLAQTMPGLVKTNENSLSTFLKQNRLNLRDYRKAYMITTLKRLNRKHLKRFHGKAVLIIDSTAHPKPRSRGKTRAMPKIGQVRLHNLSDQETILVPGYQEIWVSLLLKDRRCIPIARRLWTERGPNCASMNLVEEAEIANACELIREAFGLKVILIADRGFRRKDLLGWLKKQQKMDFVIRIEGKLTVQQHNEKGLLSDLALDWKNRVRMPWRDNSKRPLVSDISSGAVSVALSKTGSLRFNALCLRSVHGNADPMFLATTLSVVALQDLMMVVHLYSARWTIETFFWTFKNSLKAKSWRVFSSWQAIDHLLTAAHMAYVVLVLLAVFCLQDRHPQSFNLRRKLKLILRVRFARPPELTQGRLFTLLSMDPGAWGWVL